ncbi:MAG TPA: ATP-binding protein [Candidatus Saccharimonadales bacterium]|nr:ATP-binding protein [Candidatus Saccharimonadales bacterium]
MVLYGLSGTTLVVPQHAALIAGFNALFSIGAYFLARRKASYYVALSAYITTFFTAGVLIQATGNTWSPFISLWLLIGVFSGVLGWWVILFLAACSNAFVAYQLFASGIEYSAVRIIEIILVAEAPLVASYIIWHSQSKSEKEGDNKQVTALTQQLTAATSKSDIVINAIADGVVAIGSDRTIQLINPAAQTLLGWPSKDALGLDYRSVIKLSGAKGQPIPEDFSPIRQGLLSNKPIENHDLELTTKSGKIILISLIVSPVSQEGGGVIAVFRDITREKEEERQKAEFISTASHEMRTPVAAIEGYLSLAMNPATATIDSKAASYLQKAHESTQHLGRLFQDLLTVSKADDARLVPHPTVIDLVALTREIIFSLQDKAKKKGIFLTFIPGDNDTDSTRRITPVYYTYADQDQIREVLSNLIDNGVKYTKQGTVSVDVTGDDQSVSVIVTDSGIGIPPEDVSHLFQKFYRVDNSDTREIGGTGLGLYISRRLVESNNGHIGVNSTFGKGSTFYVQLPRLTHDQANAIMAADTSPKQTQAKPVPAATSSRPATNPPTQAQAV